jgi:hypothetical protein
MFALTRDEEKVLFGLNTPAKIQDFLNELAINHEKKGETYLSPCRVLQEKKAHCLEGALLAATALWLHGEKPLLMDLRTREDDDDHVVALYKKNGYWGAISKTNHAVLRFRDPVYKTLRELALSYFHEYFLSKNGEKTLEEYSAPFSLKKLGEGWITTSDDLYYIAEAIDNSRHFPLVPKANKRHLRTADAIEIRTGKVIEWTERDPRT